MKVVAIAQREGVSPQFFLTPEREYVVFGLTLHSSSDARGLNAKFELLDDFGNLVSAPMDLFHVVEGSVSPCWTLKIVDGSILVWPAEFFERYFHDDLSEGLPEAVKAFSRVRSRISG